MKKVEKERAKKYAVSYPWDEWFARKEFTLVRGEDFHSTMVGMRQMIRRQAVWRNVGVKTTVWGETIHVLVCKKGEWKNAPRHLR